MEVEPASAWNLEDEIVQSLADERESGWIYVENLKIPNHGRGQFVPVFL